MSRSRRGRGPVPHLHQFGADQAGDGLRAPELPLDLGEALSPLARLFEDHPDLEPGQPVDPQFEDGFGLLRIQRQLGHDLRRRVPLAVGGPHDLEHPVEGVEDPREAFQQVQPRGEPAPLVLEAPPDHLAAEIEEVPEQHLQADPFRRPARRTVEAQAGQVHRDRSLQRGAAVEEAEHLRGLDLLAHFQPDADIVGREVADIEQRGQGAVRHDLPEPLHQLGLVDPVGDRSDVEGAHLAPHSRFLDGPPHPDRALALLVDRPQALRRVEDLPAGGEVRPPHDPGEGAGVERRVVEQRDQRRGDLDRIVGRDVRRHPHRDSGAPVDEEQRQPGGEHHRLRPRAVVGGAVGDGVGGNLAEHLFGAFRQPALGVAHRRRGVAVEGTEVPGSLDQRQPGGERLRHPRQRLVDGGVAVRVVGAHHIADDLGALAEPPVGPESLPPHGGEDAALHRLQAVADIGQRPAPDDRERVGPVALAGDLAEVHRLRFPARSAEERQQRGRGGRGGPGWGVGRRVGRGAGPGALAGHESQQPVDKVGRHSTGDDIPSERFALRCKSVGIRSVCLPIRALSAGRLAGLGARPTLSTDCWERGRADRARAECAP